MAVMQLKIPNPFYCRFVRSLVNLIFYHLYLPMTFGYLCFEGVRSEIHAVSLGLNIEQSDAVFSIMLVLVSLHTERVQGNCFAAGFNHNSTAVF